MRRLLKRQSLDIFLTDLVVWMLAMTLFVILRFAPEYSNPIQQASTPENFDYILWLGLQSGLILGIVYGIVDVILDQHWLRRKSYGSILIIKGFIHLTIIILIGALVRIEIFDKLQIDLTREAFRNSLFNPGLIIILGYTSLVSFFLNFSRQINLKFGPGNLWKFITGRFHHPKEEERIFMFLDMKNSTTIAEELGHVKFGELVQDCFSDLSVVRNCSAEVYQYVGDEAILYWEVEAGLHQGNCIRAFFEYMDLLKSRETYYLTQYGVCPEFKAGVNIGAVKKANAIKIKRICSSQKRYI